MTFGEPRRVGAGPGHADAPKHALDRDGTLHLVYGNSPGGPLERYDILYARRTAGREVFERPRTISTPLPKRLVGAGFPYRAIAQDGRVYIACELFRPRGPHCPAALALVRLLDGGDSLSASAVVPGTGNPGTGVNGSQQGLLIPVFSRRG